MQFSDLQLSEPILRAVAHEGYTTPTPIQAQAIPHIVQGRDVLGCAQTGTGKTAAFSLPILHRLNTSVAHGHHPHPNQHHHRPIRALILSPTRELALQIEESMRTYGRHTHLRTACIFGGVNQNPQTRALKQGVDIVIATPGRLIDLMEQGYVDLSKVEVFVLDEADRMLDMGFIQPIRRIAHDVPKKRQTLLFSATMPKEIRHLADSLLSNPVSVQVAAVAATPDLVEQSVYFVSKREKPALLAGFLGSRRVDRALVFTRTKHGADRVAKDLNRAGIKSDAIHGNKRQNVRQRTLANFRAGKVWVLVATDIAARGIDVEGVSHVVNYDLPNEPETYVHRIGRTARAGASGEAVAFCDRASEERDYLRLIERLIRKPIRVRDDDPSVEMPRQAAGAPQPQAEVHVRPQHAPREMAARDQRPAQARAPRDHGQRSDSRTASHGGDRSTHPRPHGPRGNPNRNGQQRQEQGGGHKAHHPRSEGHRKAGHGHDGQAQGARSGGQGHHRGQSQGFKQNGFKRKFRGGPRPGSQGR